MMITTNTPSSWSCTKYFLILFTMVSYRIRISQRHIQKISNDISTSQNRNNNWEVAAGVEEEGYDTTIIRVSSQDEVIEEEQEAATTFCQTIVTTRPTIVDDSYYVSLQRVLRNQTRHYSTGPRGYQKRILDQILDDIDVVVPTTTTTLSSTNSNENINNFDSSSTSTSTSCQVCLDGVYQCLQPTSSNISLMYPNDAEYHFNEIRLVLAQWSQHDHHKMHRASKYSGPWIENYWITHMEELYTQYRQQQQPKQRCLSTIFGPYIPILIPFVDNWVNHKYSYENEFITALLSVLRPNVPYITVSQNADGIPGRHSRLQDFHIEFPNVIVLSAGGYGHVPIPLVKQSEQHITPSIPILQRTHYITYAGSLVNAPRNMRRQMHDIFTNWSTTTNQKQMQIQHHTDTTSVTSSFSVTTTNDTNENELIVYQYYKGEYWRNFMSKSIYNLVPRGYGRTSYHLMETLQLGLVPIHIYTDIPWIPYQNLLVNQLQIVQMIQFTNLTTFLQEQMTHEYYELLSSSSSGKKKNVTTTTTSSSINDILQQKEIQIASLRDSHFTISGILAQIDAFMMQGQQQDDNGSSGGGPQQRPSTSDLQCVALPRTVRDAD